MLIARSAIEGENRLLLSGLIHSCLGCRKSCFNRELCTKNKTSGVLLRHRFYSFKPSESLKYAALGLLFVNIAVGGVLTQFASPPVVIVSSLLELEFSIHADPFWLEGGGGNHLVEFANSPNPAGQSILASPFGEAGVSPLCVHSPSLQSWKIILRL